MTIDLNQPLELVMNCGTVLSFKPTVIGTYYEDRCVSVRWGVNDVMLTGFSLDDGSWDTGEGENMSIRNVKREPDVFNMSFREMIDAGKVNLKDGTVSINDGRYDYTVHLFVKKFGRSEGKPYITAGCREWDSLTDAMDHYNSYYSGTGDRKLCRRIIDKLDDWHIEYCANPSAYPELVAPKPLINGWYKMDGESESDKSYENAATVTIADTPTHLYVNIDGWYFDEDATNGLIDDLIAIRDAKWGSDNN